MLGILISTFFMKKTNKFHTKNVERHFLKEILPNVEEDYVI